MPRHTITAVLAAAGLAAAGWYARRHAARIAYKAFLLGRATEQERQTRDAAESEPVV